MDHQAIVIMRYILVHGNRLQLYGKKHFSSCLMCDWWAPVWQMHRKENTALQWNSFERIFNSRLFLYSFLPGKTPRD